MGGQAVVALRNRAGDGSWWGDKQTVPQLSRPVSIHAWAFDQQKENPAQYKHDWKHQNSLQQVVSPEIVSKVYWLRYAADRRDDKEMEKVQAVTHPADVSNHRMAEEF